MMQASVHLCAPASLLSMPGIASGAALHFMALHQVVVMRNRGHLGTPMRLLPLGLHQVVQVWHHVVPGAANLDADVTDAGGGGGGGSGAGEFAAAGNGAGCECGAADGDGHSAAGSVAAGGVPAVAPLTDSSQAAVEVGAAGQAC
eukprot:scaffold147628_cov17-Tisochrysis_lutea.AAC.1